MKIVFFAAEAEIDPTTVDCKIEAVAYISERRFWVTGFSANQALSMKAR
jgi:hypothetical protein